MMPRFRSFYGKVITFTLVALIFIIYIRVLKVEEDILPSLPSLPANAALSKNRLSNTESENNDGDISIEDGIQYRYLVSNKVQWPVPALRKPPPNDLNVPLELSIQRDLAKQEPDLGNMGDAAYLEGDAKILGEQIYKKIALNEELSERLSYNRTLDDFRHPLCAKKHYDVDILPSTSVIVIFYNEPYSVLLRTVHSTLNTCAGRLLKQIILVDDGSTNEELGEKLDYYIRTRIPSGKVSVLRLKSRMGLIRARLAGARVATGDVLIFLDAHCEANMGWCEPLLQRIKESRTSVLVPIIDVIDARDFKYNTNGYKSFQVGGFQWSGHFDWITVSNRERKRQQRECKDDDLDICPTYSPTMAGGLFAIDRNYFWEIGSYDEQMDGWGGENLEMSFRIWQCGGTIETVPCSRVGHIFRDFHPYKFPNNRDTHGINTARMALVWMDEYMNIFFLNRPDLKFHADIGDVTHRIILRRKLRCKSFDWYLKNVYPEKFVPTKNMKAYGKIRSLNSNLCLDDLQQNNENPFNLGVYTCSEQIAKTQFFSLTKNNVLRNELACATVQHSDSPPYLIVMTTCFENDDLNEKWIYAKNRIKHLNTGMCLDHRGLHHDDYVQVSTCDPYSMTQSWIIDHRDEMLLNQV